MRCRRGNLSVSLSFKVGTRSFNQMFHSLFPERNEYFLTEKLAFLVLNVNNNRKLVSTKKYFMIFIKISRCSWTLLYMCHVVETYVYIGKSRKQAVFNRVMYVLSRKNRGAKES